MLSDELLTIDDYWGKLRYGSGIKGYFFTYYNSSSSDFFKEECREIIERKFDQYDKYFGFLKTGINMVKFNEFWDYIENKLNLEPKSAIHKTNIRDAIIIKFSPFWVKNRTNKSLFTLLIRLGACYYEGDFNVAVELYPLAKIVKLAIERFLDGYTVPTYDDLTPIFPFGSSRNMEGFVTQFQFKTKEEIEKMLIKP